MTHAIAAVAGVVVADMVDCLAAEGAELAADTHRGDRICDRAAAAQEAAGEPLACQVDVSV